MTSVNRELGVRSGRSITRVAGGRDGSGQLNTRLIATPIALAAQALQAKAIGNERSSKDRQLESLDLHVILLSFHLKGAELSATSVLNRLANQEENAGPRTGASP